ncbi:MAG: hypothetical protein IT236_14980 [Bacteroidia bacterium]|nr:hypothetical protein [Bacteroidia bacterium]
MKKRFLSTFTILVFCFLCNPLVAQDLVGKWLIDDVTITVARKVSVVEQDQLNFLKTEFLKANKGVTVHDYRKDGTLVMFYTDSTGVNEIARYKWWVKGNRLFTTNPAFAKGYVITYKVQGNVLYESSLEVPHKVTMNMKMLKQN